MTVEEQRRSQSYTDKFVAWLLEALTSGQHGDLVRLMAGGKSAAMQLDHINKYGSARPVVSGVPNGDASSSSDSSDSSSSGSTGEPAKV